MPRARRAQAEVEEAERELSGLPADPEPGTPAKRGPGRPRGSTTRSTGTRGRISARNSSGKIMSKAELIETAHAEIHTWLSIAVAGWAMRDPDCAGPGFDLVKIPGSRGTIEVERLEAMTRKLTEIIARNDKVLEKIVKTGVLGEIVALLHLATPWVTAIWKAHGVGGTGHGEKAKTADDYSGYLPYTPVPGN